MWEITKKALKIGFPLGKSLKQTLTSLGNLKYSRQGWK